jgi:hypothetical protein
MNKILYFSIVVSGLLLFTIESVPANAQKNSTTKRRTTTKSATKVTRSNSISAFPGQFPESSERVLTDKDMEHRTPWGLKVMQNEIYARHGYIFKDAALRKHFRKEKWYKGKEKNLNSIKLSPIEIQNIAFIKEYDPRAKQ